MSKPTTPPGPWYRITTSEKNNEATIMLYDAIGDYYDIDDDGYWKNVGVKDIEFVKELDRLAEKYATIHLRINSPGGEIFHGAAIVNAILACKAEVHTWNDGLAASMAAIIWAAGKKRHMAKNALLMFHSGLWYCVGNPGDMRECADTLDKMNDAMIQGMTATLDMTEQEIRDAWFSDYKDHWLSHSDATAANLVNATSEYQITDDNPAATLQGMTYRQLVAHFQKTQHPDAPGWLDRIRAAFTNTLNTFTHTAPAAPSAEAKNNIDMTLDEFKTALADGTLNPADVQAHLATIAPATETETENPAETDAATDSAIADMRADLDAALAANTNLQTQMTALAEQVKAFGNKPGAGKASPGLPGDDAPDATEASALELIKRELAATNAALVKNGDTLSVKSK